MLELTFQAVVTTNLQCICYSFRYRIPSNRIARCYIRYGSPVSKSP